MTRTLTIIMFLFFNTKCIPNDKTNVIWQNGVVLLAEADLAWSYSLLFLVRKYAGLAYIPAATVIWTTANKPA